MHFELYKDKAGSWRWRLVARNGETVADSAEGYSSKANARAGIDLVKSASDAEVREL